MLDKTSRKLLTYVVKNEPNMDDGLFTFDYVGKSLGLSDEEMFDCIRFLDSQGLLRCVYFEFGSTPSNQALWGFAPNHKGRHHREFSIMEAFQTILKSVLLPLLVAVVTTLILS